jgi:hypothetical protein
MSEQAIVTSGDAVLHVLRRMAGGARLWDNLGLYGVPGLEDPNHDLELIRRATFTRLVRRGLVAFDHDEITGAVYALTEAGRLAIETVAAATGGGAGR